MSVTIRDVAKAAEVSTATVSNVLNKTGKVGGETRRLVLSTVRGWDTFGTYMRGTWLRATGALWASSFPTSRIHFSRK